MLYSVEIGYVLNKKIHEQEEQERKPDNFFLEEQLDNIKQLESDKFKINYYSQPSLYYEGNSYKLIVFETDYDKEEIKRYIKEKLDIVSIDDDYAVYSLFAALRNMDTLRDTHITLEDFLNPVPDKAIYFDGITTIINELNVFLKHCGTDIYLQLNPLDDSGYYKASVSSPDCYYSDPYIYDVIGVMKKGKIIGNMWFYIDRNLKYIHLDNGCVTKLERGKSLSVLARLPLILFGHRNPELIELIGSFTVPKNRAKKGDKILVSRMLLQKYFGFYTHYPRGIYSYVADNLVSSSISEAIQNLTIAGAGAGAGAEEDKEEDEVDKSVIFIVDEDSLFKNNFIPENRYNKKYALSIKNYILSHKYFIAHNIHKYFANTFLLIKDMNPKYLEDTLKLFETCKKPLQ